MLSASSYNTGQQIHFDFSYVVDARGGVVAVVLPKEFSCS